MTAIPVKLEDKVGLIERYIKIVCTPFDYDNHNVFHAFNQKQFDEEFEKRYQKDNTLLKSHFVTNRLRNIFGTKDGLMALQHHYDTVIAGKVRDEIPPQIVYDFEYSNQECEVEDDDVLAIETIVFYYGKDIAKTIVRKSAIVDINDIE